MKHLTHGYLFRAASIAVLAIGSASISASIYAQSAAANAPANADAADAATSPSPAATVDDSKLEKFADAYVAIQGLQKEAATAQSASPDPSVTQQKQAELQGKMADAVQKTGLQVNEFNQIAQAMVTDVDLRQRVIAKVQQRSSLTPGS